jgi:hypothetical protein
VRDARIVARSCLLTIDLLLSFIPAMPAMQVYRCINNGVYRAGFSTTQAASLAV